MPPPRRHRPSSIDRLDPEIKDLIGKLRIDFGWTIDEILKKLRELGQGDISRSALGRHVQTIEEIGAQLREARETAQALVRQVGEGGEDRIADLNIELAQSMIMKMMTTINADGDGQPVLLGPQELMLVTKAIGQAVNARKTNTDLVLKVRQETAKKAAAVIDATAKEAAAGLTKDTVDLIKRRIMGIAS